MGWGGRTWQNYCRTLGLVEFRGAEGPTSMRNHVTGGGGGRGRRMARASGCPSGCPAGSAGGHTSTTSEKPFNLREQSPDTPSCNQCMLVVASAALACEERVQTAESRTNECMRNKM